MKNIMLLILLISITKYTAAQCSSITDFQTNSTFDPCPPFPLQFSVLPSADTVVYHWDFGNGDTSSANNPVYVYSRPGVFTVALIVSDSAGICRDTITKVDYITLRGPQVVATVSEDSGTVPHPITINASFEDVVTWTITTGDGEVFTEPTFPLNYIYSVAGEYVVTVSTENELGCSYAIDIDTIICIDTTSVGIPEGEKKHGLKLSVTQSESIIAFTIDGGLQNNSIEVYTATGQLLSRQNLYSTKTEISVAELSTGIYIAVLKEGSAVVGSTKFIRQ